MSTATLMAVLVIPALLVGSFLNTVIVRVPAKESVLGPSRCPLCDEPIRWSDQIPLVSWVMLKGRCRNCDGTIPAGYPLVELANLVLWLAMAWKVGESWGGSIVLLIPMLALSSVLLALSVIDLELYILPNRITYPAILASLVGIPIVAYLATDNATTFIARAYVGGIAYSGFLAFTLIAYELIVRREAMGIGDVKLAALLGMWLAFVHPILVLWGLILASVLGVLVGVVVLVVRRQSKPYPFGPWLAIGALMAILLSEQLTG